MPVETAIDRSYLLSDFGVSANYTPVGGASTTVTVIFDNEYFPVDGAGSVVFAMQQPKAFGRTADFVSVSEGATLALDGTTYTIRVVMPDGTGMTEFMLEAPS